MCTFTCIYNAYILWSNILRLYFISLYYICNKYFINSAQGFSTHQILFDGSIMNIFWKMILQNRNQYRLSIVLHEFLGFFFFLVFLHFFLHFFSKMGILYTSMLNFEPISGPQYCFGGHCFNNLESTYFKDACIVIYHILHFLEDWFVTRRCYGISLLYFF